MAESLQLLIELCIDKGKEMREAQTSPAGMVRWAQSLYESVNSSGERPDVLDFGIALYLFTGGIPMETILRGLSEVFNRPHSELCRLVQNFGLPSRILTTIVQKGLGVSRKNAKLLLDANYQRKL
jgi:hypothetical protein